MSPQLLALRILSLALIGSAIFFSVPLWFVLVSPHGSVGVETDGLAMPPTWSLVVMLAIVALTKSLLLTVGYRVASLPVATSADEAGRRGAAAFRSSSMIRFVLAEIPVLIGMALAFVVDRGGFEVFAIGEAFTIVFAVQHVWPSERNIMRVQERLEAEGARVPLRDVLRSPTRVA